MTRFGEPKAGGFLLAPCKVHYWGTREKGFLFQMWKYLFLSQCSGKKTTSVLLLTIKMNAGSCGPSALCAILLPRKSQNNFDLGDYPSLTQSRADAGNLGFAHSNLEYLQGWKPHNLTGQSATKLGGAEPSPAWKPWVTLKKAFDPCSLCFLVGMVGGVDKAFRLQRHLVTLLTCAVDIPMKCYTSSIPSVRYTAPDALLLEMLLCPIQRGDSQLLGGNKIKWKAQRHLTLIFCHLWGYVMSPSQPQ